MPQHGVKQIEVQKLPKQNEKDPKFSDYSVGAVPDLVEQQKDKEVEAKEVNKSIAIGDGDSDR